MQVYLDNSATTRAYPEVADIMRECLLEDYGNPSSMHHLGVVAENYRKDSVGKIARALKVNEKEIYFTSGGTEADNLALFGIMHAYHRSGKHLITTSIEHPAILNTCRALEEQGFEVTYLPVESDGRVTVNSVKEALRPDTTLVSVMYVNNEIGSVQPIAEIGAMLAGEGKKIAPHVHFHTDAVQGFGHFEIHPKKAHIDLMSVSGHKIHGPKGIGFLYADSSLKLIPVLYGGGQEKNIRPGTENVPAIAGIGVAAEKVTAWQRPGGQSTNGPVTESGVSLYELKAKFKERLLSMPDVCVHPGEAPHIVSAGFSGVKAEVLLHALEDKGIYVSSGSACASNHPGISGTLSAIGCERQYLESTIRFSMSEYTTLEELEYTADRVEKLLPMLRRFTRR